MFIINTYQNTVVPAAIAKQVQEIYESNFPAAERALFGSLLGGIEKGGTWLFCVGQKERISGFATINPLSRGKIYFLGYIAIERDFQGKGLGSLLVQAIRTKLELIQASGLLLEVEAPEESGMEVERKTRLRRIRFYEKNEGELVEDGGIYRMPDLAAPGSLAMRLMWIAAAGNHGSGVPLELRDLLTLIYSEMYGLDASAPLVRAVLNQLS